MHARPIRDLLLASTLLLVAAAPHTGAEVPAEPQAPAPELAALVPPPPIDLTGMSFDPALGRWIAPAGDARAVLTVDPRLQARLERYLASYAVPWAAVVLMEPDTGRVVALAEHSREEPGRRGLPVRAFAPAASIFKIVTAAALLEQGVLPDAEVCYHGGRHRLQPRLLADDPRRDRRCTTLEAAFGRSTNVVFAKLADRGLSAEALRGEAERFLFNAALPVGARTEISRAEIAEDEFELASTAAGFGPVRLSALHGAILASIVANRGVLVPPVLADVAAGQAPGTAEPVRIVDEAVGEALAEMMRRTVTDGTARRAFRRPTAALRGVEVAGKTGSLADRDPYRDHSWFIGYAPADRPRVAVAVFVTNGRLWRVRAPTVAREALDAYFSVRLADGGSSGLWRTAAVR
jgi:cell division protein FtsI/penicillin-binding protein 2